jgi:hypothetical protein
VLRWACFWCPRHSPVLLSLSLSFVPLSLADFRAAWARTVCLDFGEAWLVLRPYELLVRTRARGEKVEVAGCCQTGVGNSSSFCIPSISVLSLSASCQLIASSLPAHCQFIARCLGLYVVNPNRKMFTTSSLWSVCLVCPGRVSHCLKTLRPDPDLNKTLVFFVSPQAETSCPAGPRTSLKTSKSGLSPKNFSFLLFSFSNLIHPPNTKYIIHTKKYPSIFLTIMC